MGYGELGLEGDCLDEELLVDDHVGIGELLEIGVEVDFELFLDDALGRPDLEYGGVGGFDLERKVEEGTLKARRVGLERVRVKGCGLFQSKTTSVDVSWSIIMNILIIIWFLWLSRSS